MKFFLCMSLTLMLFATAALGASPADDYLGDWENDSRPLKLSIGSDMISLYHPKGVSGMSYTITSDGLVFDYQEKTTVLRLTDDGGLAADNIRGTFYPADSGRERKLYTLLEPYLGAWFNRESNMRLQVKKDSYVRYSAGGFSPGVPDIDDDGSLVLFNSRGRLNEKGQLIFEDDGIFERVGSGKKAAQTAGESQESRAATESGADKQAVRDDPTTIRLLATDADRSQASDVIVEPDTPPYNLGGWKSDNIILFTFNTTVAGTYDITLLYSKNRLGGDEQPLRVGRWNKESRRSEGESISIRLPFTGSDWSTYRELAIGRLELPAGQVTLMLKSLAGDGGEYVMNLRELKAKLVD